MIKKTFLIELIEYFKNDFFKEIKLWVQYIHYYLMPIIILLIMTITVIIYINPIPPKQAYLATGQMGSSYKLISQEIDHFFDRSGMDLVLVDTAGLQDGLDRLRDEKSPVNASFITSGSALQKDFPNLVSLGSVQYSPIWIFYRGNEVKLDNPIDYFGKMRISIGLPKTTTQNIFLRLSEKSKFRGIKQDNFFEYSHQEAAEKLIAGELDAVFIVDGINSPSVQKLLNAKNIQIYDFVIADAYEKQFPFLSKLSIPKGGLNIETVFPNKDIHLIAPTVMLLVERDMHPVMQWSFLLAARDLGKSHNQFFANPGFFPRYTDESFELSPVAKRYYDSGVPVLFKYLPIWLASLIDEVWFYIFSAFALIYPLKKLLFSFREIPSSAFVDDSYEELHQLEYRSKSSSNVRELEELDVRLSTLEREISATWIESGKLGNSYTLRNSLARIKSENKKKIEMLKKESASLS